MNIEKIDFELINNDSNLFQSGFWGFFKDHVEQEAMGFIVSHGTMRFPLVTIRRSLGNGIEYFYAPRAPQSPLSEADQGPFLESLSHELRRYFPQHIPFIRYDTMWQSPFLDDDYYSADRQWEGPPRRAVRELRMNWFTEKKRLRKAGTDLIPPDTVIIDLDRPETRIMADMRQNTRNCIRKSARMGVRVLEADFSELPVWYDLYHATALRKGFPAHDYAYFENLLRFAGIYRNQTDDDHTSPEFRILFAIADNSIAAGMILGIHGKSAYYLYSGSSTENREYMPNYALQWEAIRMTREAGCKTYDLFGIPHNGSPEHVQAGLYTFKTGLGGSKIHYRGCWDFPFHQDEYQDVRSIESLS